MAERRHLTGENIGLAIMVLLLVGAGVYVCHSAYHWRATEPRIAQAHNFAALPPLLGPSSDIDANQMDSGGAPTASRDQRPVAQEIESAPPNVLTLAAPAAKSAVGSAPLPPSRPADLGYLDVRRRDSQSASPSLGKLAPRPNDQPTSAAALGALQAEISSRYDRFTAIYDVSGHSVYLPNGARLEAHSGLGDRLDDPRYVDEPDRGATPPHVYELSLREQPFHGVQALRLNPVGGTGEIFGRAGLLAHTYMLGPNGDSNGCVSFKDYDAFLQAFENGSVKRLAVVARLN